jgi:hypothetical protein
MTTGQKPTEHELLQLQELLRVETMEIQKTQAILPMIGDADLRQELSACLQTGTAHVKALVNYCQTQQLVPQ